MRAGVRKETWGRVFQEEEGWQQNSRGYKGRMWVVSFRQTGVARTSGTKQDGVFAVAAVTHCHKHRGLKPRRHVLFTASVRSPHSVSQG